MTCRFTSLAATSDDDDDGSRTLGSNECSSGNRMNRRRGEEEGKGTKREREREHWHAPVLWLHWLKHRHSQ